MRRPVLLAAAVLAILAVPLVAMAFTREVAWGPEDFLFAALLLGGGAVLFELAMRRLRRPVHQALAAAALGGVVLLVWAQAGVGVF